MIKRTFGFEGRSGEGFSALVECDMQPTMAKQTIGLSKLITGMVCSLKRSLNGKKAQVTAVEQSSAFLLG